MIGWLRKSVSRAVMRGSVRGNPLARRLNARATKAFIASLPPQSAFVPGPFDIPDLTRPVENARAARLFGDYELVPLRRAPVDPAALVGARVDDIQTGLGSNGMGAYGFVGLLIADRWLIVPIFAAAEWMVLDGRPLAGPAAGNAWLTDDPGGVALSARLSGVRIADCDIRAHSLWIAFETGAVLAIDPDPATRPRQMQSGHARAFLPDDDLRSALFFSPSPILYG